VPGTSFLMRLIPANGLVGRGCGLAVEQWPRPFRETSTEAGF
jgi:hypothetical protein